MAPYMYQSSSVIAHIQLLKLHIYIFISILFIRIRVWTMKWNEQIIRIFLVYQLEKSNLILLRQLARTHMVFTGVLPISMRRNVCNFQVWPAPIWTQYKEIQLNNLRCLNNIISLFKTLITWLLSSFPFKRKHYYSITHWISTNLD